MPLFNHSAWVSDPALLFYLGRRTVTPPSWHTEMKLFREVAYLRTVAWPGFLVRGKPKNLNKTALDEVPKPRGPVISGYESFSQPTEETK